MCLRLFAMAAALALLPISVAHATSFTFSATSGGFTASGFLIGEPDPFAPGAFDIMSASGLINGTPLSLVTDATNSQSPGYADGFEFDNVFYPGNDPFTGFQVDDQGLLFEFDGGAQAVNFFADPDMIYEIRQSPDYAQTDHVPVPFVASVTPEPSSLVLFGTGIVGVAGMMRRRRIL